MDKGTVELGICYRQNAYSIGMNIRKNENHPTVNRSLYDPPHRLHKGVFITRYLVDGIALSSRDMKSDDLSGGSHGRHRLSLL